MTEDYINGYLEAVSRVKDILTPNVGGTNQLFSIDKNIELDLLSNIKVFLRKSIEYYKRFYTLEEFEKKLEQISLIKIDKWSENFPSLISTWTCDKDLAGINGKNGYFLSEYFVDFLLLDFFRYKQVKFYKMLPDWSEWHWGDHMSEEYVIETDEKIYILHFGESS